VNAPTGRERRANAAPAADIAGSTNVGLHRTITGIVTVAPVALLLVAVWQSWNENLHWHDLVVFAITYVPIGSV
jgi:hypothetical protein